MRFVGTKVDELTLTFLQSDPGAAFHIDSSVTDIDNLKPNVVS